MNAVYTRVSTEEQEKTGYSLASQNNACQNRLLSMGLGNIKLYEDGGFSGEFLDRPALIKLRSDLRAGLIENICIHDPDRLSRNLINQLLIADEIESAHVNLFFVTGDYDASPEGKLFFQMRGAISSFEKAKIRERTSRGRKQKGLSGKIVIPGKPYGYDFDKETSQYVINEEEAKIVRLIYDMYVNQDIGGVNAITTELAHLGYQGRKSGTPLSINCVERVLTRDIYYGQHYIFRQSTVKTGQKTRKITNIAREDWLPVTAPPIVTSELWQAAQAQRNKNRKYSSRNTTHEYLLQKIIFCSLCSRGLNAFDRPAKRKSGNIYHNYYYRCITRESASYSLMKTKCECRNIPSKKFDDKLWNLLVNIVKEQDSLDNYLKATDQTDYSKSIQELTVRYHELKKQREDITRWYRENIIDSEMAERDLKAINRDLAQITTSLNGSLLAQKQRASIIRLDAEKILNAKTFEEKRIAILNSGLKVYAVRTAEDTSFYFSY